MGLTLEKESEYMDKKGISVNVVHHIKINMNQMLGGGGDFLIKLQGILDEKYGCRFKEHLSERWKHFL